MYWLLGLAIVGYFVYRMLSNSVRQATKIIGFQINVKPTLVTECISRMRTDANAALGKMTRQQYFCHLVISSQGNQSQLNDPIKVFYIYQILRNSHEQNVIWWAEKIVSAGFKANISPSEKELFQTFFDVDWSEFNEFVDAHNEKVIQQIV
ncbi:DUF1198 family protein [Vibrio splendidus]|uniref:DUF1198 family protein n=1 Tax=Vibrio splendidus TaxID=29497 RepID=UPI000CB830A9|nr:DUF1198 family protein [Vibrio splendidus]PMH12839.1 hypothetical protein BCU77_03860 [Vibrio splendidus]RIH73226.1 hypothetical protein BJG01_16570 [Vibrio splendidus]URM16112.1 DUF1198 family protein [Vibrio splendidus]